jgi:hypothetical protein
VGIQSRVSGLSNTVLAVIDPSAPLAAVNSVPCTGYAINAIGKVAVLVDLGPTYFAGGVLTVQSLGTGTTLDSVLWVGRGCPTNPTAFNCVAGNDDFGGTLQSFIQLTGWSSRFFSVLVAGYSAVGSVIVRIDYALPSVTPTQTGTPVATGTATLSLGASPSSTATGTASSSQTASSTPSADYTVDPSDPPSFTPSLSATASLTASLAAGLAPSISNTGTPASTPANTGTPVPSPTSQCPVTLGSQLRLLSGSSASSGPVVINAQSPLGWIGAPTAPCTLAYPVGPKALFQISLAGLPLGYSLTINNVINASLLTSMWVGTGCPTGNVAFQCVSSTTTTMTISETTVPYIYVVLGSSTGVSGIAHLSYTYNLPSQTPSNTPSPSGTPSASSTVSTGAAPSETASSTPSPTATKSTGFTASASPLCGVPFQQVFNGLSGGVQRVTVSSSAPALITTAAACSGGALQTNGKHAYMISLPTAFQLGGSLTVSTCSGNSSDLDTVLWVGTGCPSDATGASFRCLQSADDGLCGF